MFGSKSQKLNQPLVVPDCRLSVIAILDHNSWIGNQQSEPWWHQQVSLLWNLFWILRLMLTHLTYYRNFSLLGQQLQLVPPEKDQSGTCGRSKWYQIGLVYGLLVFFIKCSYSKNEIHYCPEFSVPPSLNMDSHDARVFKYWYLSAQQTAFYSHLKFRHKNFLPRWETSSRQEFAYQQCTQEVSVCK